jgi:hypothetical protein
MNEADDIDVIIELILDMFRARIQGIYSTATIPR